MTQACHIRMMFILPCHEVFGNYDITVLVRQVSDITNRVMCIIKSVLICMFDWDHFIHLNHDLSDISPS